MMYIKGFQQLILSLIRYSEQEMCVHVLDKYIYIRYPDQHDMDFINYCQVPLIEQTI